MPDVDLSHAIGLPPREAIQYFESKGLKISFRWQEIWREAHARAFTVAGVARLDLLADIRAAVADAVAEEVSQREFLNRLAPVLRKKGWWGPGEMTDPRTGEVRVGPRGCPARLNLIYRQNVQGAFNAGRYREQMDMAGSAPYLRYVAIRDQKTRPSHAALHGRIYRADDPVWDVIYPPNGWNCRCRVESLSERALERRGLTVESGKGMLREKLVPVRDPRTGEQEMRAVKGCRLGPDGPDFFPDAGFDDNPGRTFLRDMLADMPSPPQTAGTNWRELGLSSFRDMPDADKLPAPGELPMSESREAAEKLLAEALGFSGGERLRVVTTPLGRRTIWRDLLPHMVEKERDARERFARHVLPTLEQPHEIWLKMHADGKLRENYLAVFRGSRYSLLVVVRINRDGSLVWNMMQREPKGADKWREGWLVYSAPAWAKKEEGKN